MIDIGRSSKALACLLASACVYINGSVFKQILATVYLERIVDRADRLANLRLPARTIGPDALYRHISMTLRHSRYRTNPTIFALTERACHHGRGVSLRIPVLLPRQQHDSLSARPACLRRSRRPVNGYLIASFSVFPFITFSLSSSSPLSACHQLSRLAHAPFVVSID